MIDVAEVFEVLDGEVVPFHEEDPRHEAVSDWYFLSVTGAKIQLEGKCRFEMEKRVSGERTYQARTRSQSPPPQIAATNSH